MEPITVSGRVVQGLVQGFGQQEPSAPALELEEAVAERLAGTAHGPGALEQLRRRPDSPAAQLVLQGLVAAAIEADHQAGASLASLVETLDQWEEELWCAVEGRSFPADRFAFMPRRGVMHVLKAHYPAARHDPPPPDRRYPDDIDDDGPPPPPPMDIRVLLRELQADRVTIDIPDPVPMEPVRFDLIGEDAVALVFRPTAAPGAATARPAARHYAVDLPHQALARWRAGSAGGLGGESGKPHI